MVARFQSQHVPLGASVSKTVPLSQTAAVARVHNSRTLVSSAQDDHVDSDATRDNQDVVPACLDVTMDKTPAAPTTPNTTATESPDSSASVATSNGTTGEHRPDTVGPESHASTRITITAPTPTQNPGSSPPAQLLERLAELLPRTPGLRTPSADLLHVLAQPAAMHAGVDALTSHATRVRPIPTLHSRVSFGRDVEPFDRVLVGAVHVLLASTKGFATQILEAPNHAHLQTRPSFTEDFPDDKSCNGTPDSTAAEARDCVFCALKQLVGIFGTVLGSSDAQDAAVVEGVSR